jgi:hypothetical protein
VAFEERLAHLDDAPAMTLERAGREQQSPAEAPADREADVVAR